MAIKTWDVTAECNMDASDYRTVRVKANTERKAIMKAEDKLRKEQKVFYITNIKCKEIIEHE